MKKPLFTGACTALVTPFLDGRINFPLLELLLRRQLQAGINALVLAGTTGEAPTLTHREKLELFRRGKEAMGPDGILIAGTGSNDTVQAVELSLGAQEAGADALLVVTPYYNKANPEGLFAHYLAIAHAVTIPLILYNVPSRTGVDIPVSVCKRLSRIPNIAGIKEASTDIRKILRLRQECGDELPIWSGNDDMAVPVMALGGQGVISVTANLLPAEVNDLTQAALAGDFDTAADLQGKLQPLNDLLFSDVNPIPIKAALRRMGFDCGKCRLPLTDPSPECQALLDRFFG